MSIASELQNYADGLDDAWDAAEDMGATIPHDRNMNNLDDAIRTIPVSSPNDGVLTITQNGVTIQTFSADQATNVTAALTDTTYSDFTGATSSVAGAAGLVPAPTTADPDKYLKGDGSWGTPTDTTYTAGTNVQISAQNVISATDTTYSNFTGATSSTAGAAGVVPAPAAGDQDKVLTGAGTWVSPINLNYSYSEQDTGLTWLQGQKIYSFTYYFQSLADHGVVTQPLPSGYVATVKVEAIMRQGANVWPIPYNACWIDIDGTNLDVASPDYDFTGMDALVTLYYVKTS